MKHKARGSRTSTAKCSTHKLHADIAYTPRCATKNIIQNTFVWQAESAWQVATLPPAVPHPYLNMAILATLLSLPRSPFLSLLLSPSASVGISADLVQNIFLDYFRCFAFVCVCVRGDFCYQHEGFRSGAVRSHKTICHIYTS